MELNRDLMAVVIIIKIIAPPLKGRAIFKVLLS
jgi:hypothetical protein